MTDPVISPGSEPGIGPETFRTFGRRQFLAAGLVGGALLAAQACGPAPSSRPSSSAPPGPYGPIGPPDGNGLQLPAGFRSRVIARTGDLVPGTSYRWHRAPDGGRAFPTPDGWIYVSNCELDRVGGVGMVRFDAAGNIVDARRLLDDTNRNCSGGHTPWNTWLTGEEVVDGRIIEVDPFGVQPARIHLAMGRFEHEGAAVDEAARTVYLSEDESDGLFYRYRYEEPGDLSRGVLEVARVDGDAVSWLPVPDPAADSVPTRLQVPGATTFAGGEGIWHADGIVNMATKHDDKVWAYDVAAQQMSVVYDATTSANPVLRGVDNIAVRGQEIFVCEDQSPVGFMDDPEICLLLADGAASVFLRAVGHKESELAGVAFSPVGDRLYVSSQRGADGQGVTFEVSGPFHA